MDAKERKAYKKFTRTGLAIKGIIYVLSGTLAIIAAAGPGGRTVGRMGVLRWLNELPAGPALLLLIGIGLLGYVVLRLMQAIKDTNHKGRSWKGLARRTGYLISGIVYLVFLIGSIYILFPKADVWQEEEVNYLNKILGLPAGNIAVAIAGVFSFGYGIFEIVRGGKGSYKHHLSLQQVKKSRRLLLNAVGAVGYVARGIVLGLIGFFVVRAAFEAYVDEVGFTSKALEFISAYLGPFVMGIIAAGLALYGIFMFVKARFYQVSTE